MVSVANVVCGSAAFKPHLLAARLSNILLLPNHIDIDISTTSPPTFQLHGLTL